MKKENKKAADMTESLLTKLRQSFPDIKLNGDLKKRLPHNLNITIPGVENKALIHILKDKMSFSTGSACTTAKVKPSHVLKALGLSDDETIQTIRQGVGRDTKENGIAEIFVEGIEQLKNIL